MAPLESETSIKYFPVFFSPLIFVEIFPTTYYSARHELKLESDSLSRIYASFYIYIKSHGRGGLSF